MNVTNFKYGFPIKNVLLFSILPNSSGDLKRKYDKHMCQTQVTTYSVTVNKTNSKYWALVYATLRITLVQILSPIFILPFPEHKYSPQQRILKYVTISMVGQFSYPGKIMALMS